MHAFLNPFPYPAYTEKNGKLRNKLVSVRAGMLSTYPSLIPHNIRLTKFVSFV